MKEITYKEWQKNPTPRMMWCWDNKKYKVKRMVVYIAAVGLYPIISVNEDGLVTSYKHCAEIEKQRRMTNQELAWWLQDGIKESKHREYKFPNTKTWIVRTTFDYEEGTASEEIYGNILIRENGGEWYEPLVEVEE